MPAGRRRHTAGGPRIGGFEPLDRGIDREAQPGFVEERAGDQAAGGEHPPEGVEQGGIGRRGRAPEIVELALKGQPGNVVNRLAERHYRQSAGKRQRADRAVDGDHGRLARQERAQIAAVENDEPVGDPELDSEVTGNRGPVDQPAVEWMELDDQPRRRGRMTGEGGEDVLDRQMHRAKRRVHAHLVIAIQLQRKKKQRAGAAADTFDRRRRAPLGAAHQRQAAQPTGILDQLIIGTVRRVMREPPHSGHRGRCVEHVLDRPAAKAARHRWRVAPGRQRTGAFAIPVRIPRQRRMTIDPAFLEGDPIGPQIALLDHVNSQSAPLGDADGSSVQRPAIAEQNYVADRPVDDQPVEKLRPFFRTAAKIHSARQPPECPIAAVEINPVNRVAALDERLPEALEKSRGHPLQEKKAPAGVDRCPAWPLRRAYGTFAHR